MKISLKKAFKYATILGLLSTVFIIYNTNTELGSWSILGSIFKGGKDLEAIIKSSCNPIPLSVGSEHSNYSVIPLRTARNWDKLRAEYNVCLATQTTIDRLSTIIQQSAYWRGPIHLLIFLRTPNEIPIVQQFLQFVTFCQFSNEGNENDEAVDWFLKTVSIQIAYPTDVFNPDQEFQICAIQDMSGSVDICAKNKGSTPEDFLKTLILEHLPQGPDPNFVYPQSHMRNGAKRACAAHHDWVTVLDVDIIPKFNSANDLQTFYNSKEATECKKCAFVMPVYELAKPCTFPKTKRELIAMNKNSTAVPFHFSFWKPAHQNTNYDKWTKTHIDESPVKISHDSSYNLSVTSLKDKKRHSTYFYEPFHLAPKTIPDYEERFLGFGFTRSTQAFASLLAGWKFKVLTPTFVTHCGIQPKVKAEEFKTVPRYQQVRNNQKVYGIFIDEMLKKYNKGSNPTKS